MARLATVASLERFTNRLRACPSSSESSRTRNIGRGSSHPPGKYLRSTAETSNYSTRRGTSAVSNGTF